MSTALDRRIAIWSCGLALFIYFVSALNIVRRDGAQTFFFENEQSRIAWSLATGHGFSSPWPNTTFAPTAQQPPLYPWILAAVFRMFGPYAVLSVWAIATINASLSAATSIFIYRAGLKHFDRATALLATTLWLSFALSTRFRESILSAFLVILIMFLLPQDKREQISLSRWLGMGALAGIALLCNATLASIVFPCLVYLWIWERSAGRRAAAKLILASVMCSLILLPWTVRNYQQFRRLIPVRDNLGLELWVGNHDGVTYICDYGNNFPADHPEEFNRVGELPLFEMRGREAQTFMSSHPAEFLRLSLQRVGYFWSAPPENIKALTPVWAVLSLFSMFGAVLAMRRKGAFAVPYALALLLFPLIYYITHPLAIYRHPIEPVMALTASFAMVSAFRWIATSRSDRLNKGRAT